MAGNTKKMWRGKQKQIDTDRKHFEGQVHRYYCPKCMAGFMKDVDYKAHYKLEHGKR